MICGPIYTIADIFEDPQFQAREMLLKHEDPEFGEYVGPGIVPKLSRTPGAVRWSATWEEGSHNRRGLRRAARALGRGARRRCGRRASCERVQLARSREGRSATNPVLRDSGGARGSPHPSHAGGRGRP